MRSVTASLVGWSGRGPALLAMGCPCRELRTRRVCAACRPIGEALMPLTVPPSLLIVVEVLRPCFTAPWFATMSSLVTGALSASGPRTVTGMWQAAGLAGQAHWSRAHRFFARAVWDPDRVGLALARAVVASLAPDGAAVTVAVVDLLARPCPGAPSTWWRRPASADRPGAACPPASLHHPPGRQRGPAPTRTRRTGRRGHPAWKGERLGTAADVAATTTWTRTRVTRYRLTEDGDLAVVTCLWWAACTAPPSAWSWSAAPARPDPTPWPRPPPT